MFEVIQKLRFDLIFSKYYSEWDDGYKILYNLTDVCVLLLIIFVVICLVKVTYRHNRTLGILSAVFGPLFLFSRVADHVMDVSSSWEIAPWLGILFKFLTLIFIAALSYISLKALRGTKQLERFALENLRMSWIVSSSKDAIVSCDLEGAIVTWNPSAEKLLGYKSSEIIGKKIKVLFPDIRSDPDYLDKLVEEISIHDVICQEQTLSHKEGHSIEVLMTGSHIVDQNSQLVGYCAIYTDISEKRALEEKLRENLHHLRIANRSLSSHKKKIELANLSLRKSNELLNVRNKELNEFTYIASHDLRAPLRAITNLTEWIMEDNYDVLPRKSQEHLTLLKQRVNRMERLLDDLLVYAQLGVKNYPTEKILLNEVIEEIIKIIGSNEGVRFEIQENLPVIKTHRIPLQQVLYNLISNAIKHHPDVSKAIIKVQCESEGKFLIISITDNGSGIPQQYYKKIFKMFETLNTKDNVEGSGMGLAIVKKLVEQYDGKLSVKSKVGKGTTFTFTWPLRIKKLPFNPLYNSKKSYTDQLIIH